MITHTEGQPTAGRALPRLAFLSEAQLASVRDTALRVLAEIGIRIQNDEVLHLMADTPGVAVDTGRAVVRLPPELVLKSVGTTPHSYSLYGRDASRQATYGTGRMVFKSTPGDPLWADVETRKWRAPTLADVRQAILVADALPNIDIVGAMAHPAEIPEPVRAIHLMAELVKRTRKPVRVWVPDRRSAHYIVEILRTVAGGAAQLRRMPRTEHSLEPISPLQLGTGLEAMLEFAAAGLPIVVGPIVQSMGTGPATLAGTVAQCLAEALGTLTIIQRVQPGLPVALAAACHTMDPRTMNIVYGAPEQGLLVAATTQAIKSFGLPAIANAGYTDAKAPDAQAGLEKGMTALMAALAGADSFAPMGVAGTIGASLVQLIIDDEMIGYLRRIIQGLEVTPEALAFEVIRRVGCGGNFMTDDHTLQHVRSEFWLPGLSDRDNYVTWQARGSQTMWERAAARREQIVREHQPDWLDEATQREIDRIVAAAERELLA